MRRSRGALIGVVALVLVTGSAGPAAAANKRSDKAPFSSSYRGGFAIVEFAHTDGCLRRGVTVFGDRTSGRTPPEAPRSITEGFLEVRLEDICRDITLMDEWGLFRPTQFTIANANAAVLQGTVSIGDFEAPESERTTYLINLTWRRTGAVERSREMFNVKDPEGLHIIERGISTFAAASVTGSVATKKDPAVNIVAGLHAAGQLQYTRQGYLAIRVHGRPPA
jgi:hypothetical protein